MKHTIRMHITYHIGILKLYGTLGPWKNRDNDMDQLFTASQTWCFLFDCFFFFPGAVLRQENCEISNL